MVKANTTIPAKDSLVTTNVVRTIANPTLDFNFIRSNNLDSRFTFSRASAATYTNSRGYISYAVNNQPRFDYDPVTGQSKGLLMEDQRTNMYSYSNQASFWSTNGQGSGTLTINTASVLSPDGVSYADVVINTPNINSYARVAQSAYLTSSTYYTRSVYAKGLGGNNLLIMESQFNGGQYTTKFDLGAGTIPQIGTGTATISYVGNGWYRCAATMLSSSSTTDTMQVLYIGGYGSTSLTVPIALWGAQLEAGQFATSLIPTGSASATRIGDYLVMSGSIVSNAINPVSGTIYTEFDTICNGKTATGGNDFPFIYDFDNQTYQNDGYRCLLSAGYGPGVYTEVAANGLNPNRQIATTLGDQSVKKLATAFQLGDASAVLNGGTVYSVTPVTTLPTGIDRISIGTQSYVGGFGNFFTGHMRRLTYWPQRLSNTQISTLTAS